MKTILAVIAAFAFLVQAGADQPASPGREPERWALAHIDVETTGLDPSFHAMIDIGVIYTDLEGEELGRLYIRIMPDHPDRIEPGARAVNGFDVDYWEAQGAVSEQEAVVRLLEFHRQTAGDRTVMLTAYNAWFDHIFLGTLLSRHDASWRDMFYYHVLDIPSMAWGRGIRGVSGGEVAAALGLSPETSVPLEHTGLSGAVFNLSVYRALMVAPPID
jgi:DNA polymerase III epsilon subunit-like protein